MKRFLKKSSVLSLILIIFILGSVFAFAGDSIDDVKQNVPKDVNKVVIKQEKNVMKKSKTTKKNYSNIIRVLVTPKQKQVVQSKLRKMNNEIEMLAKVIYRESRGSSKEHQAAVAWCILNRVDYNGYGKTISGVVTAPNQFAWNPNTPVTNYQKNIAKDVVIRWLLEKQGIKKVGRTLPKTYKFFSGDGVRNYFRKDFNSITYWNWSYPNPYK